MRRCKMARFSAFLCVFAFWIFLKQFWGLQKNAICAKGAGYNKGGKGYNYSPSPWSTPSWNFYNNHYHNKGKGKRKCFTTSGSVQHHICKNFGHVAANCQAQYQHYYLHYCSYWFRNPFTTATLRPQPHFMRTTGSLRAERPITYLQQPRTMRLKQL